MDKSDKSLKSPSSFSVSLKKPSAFNNFGPIKNEQIALKNNKLKNQTSHQTNNSQTSTFKNSVKEKSKILKLWCEEDKTTITKASCGLQDAGSYCESKKTHFLSPSMLQSVAVVKSSTNVKREPENDLLKNVLQKDFSKNLPEKDLLKEEKKILKNENKFLLKNSENDEEGSLLLKKDFAFDNFEMLKKENTRVAEDLTTLKIAEDLTTLRIENNKVKNEINCLQKIVEKMERDHFQEIKSIYEKYITFQNDKDIEKKDLEKKILKLEQTVDEKEKEINSQKSIIMQQEEDMSKLQSKNMALGEKLKNVIESRNEEILLVANEKDKMIAEIFQNKNEIELLQNELAKSNEDFYDLERKNIEKDERLKVLDKYHNEIMDKNVLELTEEREKAKCLMAELKTKIEMVLDLEKQVTECKLEILSLKGADKTHSLQNEVFLQHQEINQLQQTCKILQSTNELLNVRLNALNEILRLQEVNMTGAGSSEDKILNLWRNKVYSLLVQLKLNDIN